MTAAEIATLHADDGRGRLMVGATLREHASSILVAGLGTAFGVALLQVTGALSDAVAADDVAGSSRTVTVVLSVIGVRVRDHRDLRRRDRDREHLRDDRRRTGPHDRAAAPDRGECGDPAASDRPRGTARGSGRRRRGDGRRHRRGDRDRRMGALERALLAVHAELLPPRRAAARGRRHPDDLAGVLDRIAPRAHRDTAPGDRRCAGAEPRGHARPPRSQRRGRDADGHRRRDPRARPVRRVWSPPSPS